MAAAAIPAPVEPWPHELAEPVYDSKTSARKYPFRQRKRGKWLDSVLRAGDHVLFAYHDQRYRQLID